MIKWEFNLEKKRIAIIFILIAFFIRSYSVYALSNSTTIDVYGSSEIIIGQWEPWPTDWRITIYAIPSIYGSNIISWHSDKSLISPGESLTFNVNLEGSKHSARMDFRVIFVKKSNGQTLLNRVVGMDLPQVDVPGSYTSPKIGIPAIPLEEFGVPAEIAIYFRLSLNTDYSIGMSTIGLNPSYNSLTYTSTTSKSIFFSKPSGVGAEITLSSASVRAYGSITVSLGLTVLGLPIPFSIDFATVPISDWTISSGQSESMLFLKTPIEIDFSLSSSRVNTGEYVTATGDITPAASGFFIELLINGVTGASTNTQNDGSFSLIWMANNPGTFSLSVRAPESQYTTLTTSSSKQVTVNKPPTASFSYVPITLQVDENIQFSDESYDLDGQITGWSWSFGDGSISTISNPTHVYSSAGTYSVKLTITDNNGAKSSYQKTITINKISTSISISPSSTSVTEGISITISGSIDPSVANTDVTITYTKHDGSKIIEIAEPSSGGSFSTSITPTVVGSWTVKASWEGNSIYSGSTSNQATFTVEEKSFLEKIPGYPIESIILGITISVIILWFIRLKART